MTTITKKTTFDDARARLGRAREHRRDLHSYLETVFADEANQLRVALRFDQATSTYIFFVKDVPDLRLVFQRTALIFGDGIHNLRAALDYLVHELALWNAGGALQHPERTQFIIAESPERFRDAKSRLGELSEKHREMVEAFQPYTDGRSTEDSVHPLLQLKRFSNTDKHRFLAEVEIPVTSITWPGEVFQPLAQGGRRQAYLAGWKPVEPGLELLRVEAPPNLLPEEIERRAMEHAGLITPVIIPRGHVRSVLVLLDQISSAVEGTIEYFELKF